MSELSDEAKAFLAAHDDEGLPTPEEQLRVRTAIRSAIDAGPGTVEAPRSAGSFSLAKVVAGLTAALLVGTGGALLLSREGPSTPQPPAPLEAPRVATPPQPTADLSAPLPPAPEPTSHAAPTRAVPRARPAAPQPPEPIETEPPREATSPPAPTTVAEPIDPTEEFRLIAQAQASTRDGNPAWALELLTQHERRFGGSGLLAEEAHAARVKALCGLGRVAEARLEAEQLATLNPSSVHLARVDRACW